MVTMDMAEETRERWRFVWIVCKIVNSNGRELPHDAVKGRHLVVLFIYP